MRCKVPTLPADVVGRIYGDVDLYTRFQLSRISGTCFRLWQQNRVDNVARLLRAHPDSACGYTVVQRGLKLPQNLPGGARVGLACLTLRVHVPVEALGQVLSMAAPDRRKVGCLLGRSLLGSMQDAPDDHQWLTVLLQHNANLKPGDYGTLRDLFWDFPSHSNEYPARHIAIDAQWWISCYGSPTKHPVAWNCWHYFDMDLVSNRCPPCLDSQTDFVS